MRYLAAAFISMALLATLVLYPSPTQEKTSPDDNYSATTLTPNPEFPVQQSAVPKGLRSMKHTAANGYESYADYIWYDSADAIVEAESDASWTPKKVESGDSSVIYLEWGGHHPETTGGGYTIVQIQLSDTFAQGDKFELSTPKKERRLLAEKSGLGGDLSKLKPNEIAVFNFSNPYFETLSSDDTSFQGSISISKIDDDYITINLELQGLEDFDVDGETRVFALERKMGSNAE